MTRRTISMSRSAAGWSVALAIASAACSSPAATGTPPSPVVSTPPSPVAATPGPIGSASPATSASPSDVPDQPPVARLAAEGGDPVDGQLGTYAWRDTGSDSPWLQGAAIAVGTGEPLTLTLSPDVPISAWQARYVPSSATDPAGANELGNGAGDPRFDAPADGTWTVVVHVEFADGLGDASYFWKVAVD